MSDGTMQLSKRDVELLKGWLSRFELAMGGDDSPWDSLPNDEAEATENEFWDFIKRLRAA